MLFIACFHLHLHFPSDQCHSAFSFKFLHAFLISSTFLTCKITVINGKWLLLETLKNHTVCCRCGSVEAVLRLHRARMLVTCSANPRHILSPVELVKYCIQTWQELRLCGWMTGRNFTSNSTQVCSLYHSSWFLLL